VATESITAGELISHRGQWIGVFSGSEAEEKFESPRQVRLTTHYINIEDGLFPHKSCMGYLVLQETPLQITDFSFAKRYFPKHDCILSIESPRQWLRPVFLVDRYFFGGPPDSRVVISRGARVEEADSLDCAHLLEMRVLKEETYPKIRKRVFSIARSNQKPCVLNRLLRTYKLPLEKCRGVHILDHNILQEYLRYTRQESKAANGRPY